MLGEIHSLDVQMEKAIEAYNGATDQLAAIERERALNAPRPRDREAQPVRRRSAAWAPACARCTPTPQEDSTLAILLGSHSIGEFLDRVETVNSVASQDTQVVGEVKKFKHDVTVRAAQLKIAHARQEQVVAERAAAKQQIESGLAERQQLLGSIQGEIARLQREEEARQARLAAEAQRAAAGPARRAAARPCSRRRRRTWSVPPPSRRTGSSRSRRPSQYGGVVGIAMQYLGTPVRLGRLLAGRLRLLRAS